jgi:6-pyruvoyltetrahydropterin/6-carboxytetrahydropterin synthase
VDWHTVISITKEFRFDAAHYLPTAPAVTLEGVPDALSGQIRDFAAIDAAVADVRERLDHHVLNEVEGLSLPTLERLSAWIFSALSPKLPELVSVTVRRDSLGEACTFRRP